MTTPTTIRGHHDPLTSRTTVTLDEDPLPLAPSLALWNHSQPDPHRATSEHTDPPPSHIDGKTTFYLNEYELKRTPHHNGMTYPSWTFIQCHGTYANVEDASDALDTMHPYLTQRRCGHIRPGYGPWSIWPDIYIQTEPGRDLAPERLM